MDFALRYFGGMTEGGVLPSFLGVFGALVPLAEDAGVDGGVATVVAAASASHTAPLPLRAGVLSAIFRAAARTTAGLFVLLSLSGVRRPPLTFRATSIRDTTFACAWRRRSTFFSAVLSRKSKAWFCATV